MALRFRRAYGTHIFSLAHPPLKWRAIIGGPSGPHTTCCVLPIANLLPAADVDPDSKCGGTRVILAALRPLRMKPV
jgi:hypothetical protein